MSESICRFMPAKNDTSSIQTIHFVYETELKTLRQPFLRPVYAVHLVTNGSGTLRIYDRSTSLSPGCLFFAFPGCPYELDADDSFRYLYISFTGTGAARLLESTGVGPEQPVYPGFAHITEFWMSSIARVTAQNANILAESVVLYTLSFICSQSDTAARCCCRETIFDLIADYLEQHYTDPDISLKKLSGIFSYTEKYISHLFKKNMQIGFRDYINRLRIQYACQLLMENRYSIAEIAWRCGYRDALYFSKVFRKREGLPPNEYLLRRTQSGDLL